MSSVEAKPQKSFITERQKKQLNHWDIWLSRVFAEIDFDKKFPTWREKWEEKERIEREQRVRQKTGT